MRAWDEVSSDEVLVMQMPRVVLLLLLIVGFAGCKAASEQRAALLIREANVQLKEGTELQGQWTAEYMKAFNPRSRAQFPGNRESLKAAAEKITTLIDESSRFNDQAISKYEQASRIMDDEQQRRGTILVVSSLKTELRMNDFFKSQMQLVSDESIVTGKEFDGRFMQITKQISDAAREKENQFNEGRRLLGW